MKAVVAIGAGAAGLAAVTELVARGHTVTVLEAQERPGGRIRTLRQPFADGLYVEEGALSFSSGYRHCMRHMPAGRPSAEAATPGRATQPARRALRPSGAIVRR